MQEGVQQHPDWYEGLNENSTFEEFQGYLASHGLGGCLRPCNPDENVPPPSPGNGDVAWAYSAPFKYRWTDNNVSTAVVQVVPGQKTTLKLDGHDVQLKIPVEGAGSIGMFVGDPCIRFDPWYCKYAEKFQVKNTMHTVLNAMADHDELDYWMMYGDLFYDQGGSITREFFAGLNSASSSVLGATLGNHDYWVMGNPHAAQAADSFGNGHMQWYAQDTVAATRKESEPFNFTQSPDEYKIVDISNTFWYYTMGNVAFIGFSNAYDWEESEPYFKNACQWIKDTNPALVFLLGHWNGQNGGCTPGMATMDAFARVQQVDGCDTLGTRIKYVEGHKHCNYETEPSTGWLFGAFGFADSDSSCDGAFGLPILDTRNGKARLYYFELALQGERVDNFDTIIDCFKTKGYSKCTHYAQVWLDEPLTAPAQSLSSVDEMPARNRTFAKLNNSSLRR
jgi:hypothetical protein